MKIYAGNAGTGSRLSALFNESLTKQPSAAARDASCIFTPLKCSMELKSVARQCFSQQSLRLIAMQCSGVWRGGLIAFLMEWPLCFPVIDVLDVIPVIDVKNVMDGVFPRKGSDVSAANAKDP